MKYLSSTIRVRSIMARKDQVYICISFCLLEIVGIACAGNIRRDLFDDARFKCLSGKSIERHQFCDGNIDCEDNSDENFCQTGSSCTNHPPLVDCSNYYYGHNCIPAQWKCDGHRDCPNGEDEQNCPPIIDDGTINVRKIRISKEKALNWTLRQRYQDSPNRKWGQEVSRIAIMLYSAGDTIFWKNSTTRDEITYELTLGIFNKLAQRKMSDVSDTELASYVNAMLVTCINPRRFYSLDLLSELRKKVDSRNHTNPSVILALCNAGDSVTERDVEKLVETFGKARRSFSTDTQALVILALSCAVAQRRGVFDAEELKEMTMELKKKQYRNGTVDNLKTTALVMQAVLASESKPDTNNFDEEKAMGQILLSQAPDGSFGSLVNTYYVLPILNLRTLANITSSHCTEAQKDENVGFQDLVNQVGPKVRVQYSLWIGNDRTVERTLTLNVPLNTSFYRLMEFAADVDFRFKFEYNVRNDKPFVYSISGIQDDPENGMFWFPFQMKTIGKNNERVKSNLTAITKSPADVLLRKHEHFVFWYKRDS